MHDGRGDMFVWPREVWHMVNIRIRNLDDGKLNRLRDRASGNRRLVQEEARLLVCRIVGGTPCRTSREWASLAEPPDAMPSPDRSRIYPLRLRCTGFWTIPAMRLDGPGKP